LRDACTAWIAGLLSCALFVGACFFSTRWARYARFYAILMSYGR